MVIKPDVGMQMNLDELKNKVEDGTEMGGNYIC